MLLLAIIPSFHHNSAAHFLFSLVLGRSESLLCLEDGGEFLDECLVAERHTDVWDVGAGHVISLHTFTCVVRTEPVLLHLKNQ